MTRLIAYAINGVAATAVHYGALYTCLELLEFRYAGVANLTASVFGISSSFLGNRYFVFRSAVKPLYSQAVAFVVLFSLIALIHGTVLFVWTDVFGLNYRIGFLVAVAIQFTLGYLGSKRLIFRD